MEKEKKRRSSIGSIGDRIKNTFSSKKHKKKSSLDASISTQQDLPIICCDMANYGCQFEGTFEEMKPHMAICKTIMTFKVNTEDSIRKMQEDVRNLKEDKSIDNMEKDFDEVKRHVFKELDELRRIFKNQEINILARLTRVSSEMKSKLQEINTKLERQKIVTDEEKKEIEIDTKLERQKIVTDEVKKEICPIAHERHEEEISEILLLSRSEEIPETEPSYERETTQNTPSENIPDSSRCCITDPQSTIPFADDCKEHLLAEWNYEEASSDTVSPSTGSNEHESSLQTGSGVEGETQHAEDEAPGQFCYEDRVAECRPKPPDRPVSPTCIRARPIKLNMDQKNNSSGPDNEQPLPLKVLQEVKEEQFVTWSYNMFILTVMVVLATILFTYIF